MTKSTSSLLCILFAFAMLWIPIGQHDFLLQHWMKVGFFMAPFLFIIAFSFDTSDRDESRFRINLTILPLILFVAYIIHQFEEHWVDLFGNTYAFKPFLNTFLLNLLDAQDGSVGPLSDAGVFLINTSLVWLLASLAIWRGRNHFFPTLCLISIVFVNSISHIVSAIANISYNPGLLTAVILFLPLSTFFYYYVLKLGFSKRRLVVASLIWGVLAHVVMIAGMIASGWFHIIPEWVYFIALILWSTLPVFLFR